MLDVLAVGAFTLAGLIAGFLFCARWTARERAEAVARNEFLEREVRRLSDLLRTKNAVREHFRALGAKVAPPIPPRAS